MEGSTTAPSVKHHSVELEDCGNVNVFIQVAISEDEHDDDDDDTIMMNLGPGQCHIRPGAHHTSLSSVIKKKIGQAWLI